MVQVRNCVGSSPSSRADSAPRVVQVRIDYNFSRVTLCRAHLVRFRVSTPELSFPLSPLWGAPAAIGAIPWNGVGWNYKCFGTQLLLFLLSPSHWQIRYGNVPRELSTFLFCKQNFSSQMVATSSRPPGIIIRILYFSWRLFLLFMNIKHCGSSMSRMKIQMQLPGLDIHRHPWWRDSTVAISWAQMDSELVNGSNCSMTIIHQ